MGNLRLRKNFLNGIISIKVRQSDVIFYVNNRAIAKMKKPSDGEIGVVLLMLNMGTLSVEELRRLEILPSEIIKAIVDKLEFINIDIGEKEGEISC